MRARAGFLFAMMLVGASVSWVMGANATAADRSPNTCLRALTQAEKDHDLPAGILVAAARARRFGARPPSARLSPWSYAVVDRDMITVHVAQDETSAIAEVRPALGRRSSEARLGCALLLWRAHRRYLKTPAAAFDPETSAAYFARYVKRLYKNERRRAKAGAWTRSLGASFSKIKWKRQVHACEVAHQFSRVAGTPPPACDLK